MIDDGTDDCVGCGASVPWWLTVCAECSADALDDYLS